MPKKQTRPKLSPKNKVPPAPKAKKTTPPSPHKIIRDLVPKDAKKILENDRREMKRTIARLRRQVKELAGENGKLSQRLEDAGKKANVEADSLRREVKHLFASLRNATWERDAAHRIIRDARGKLENLLDVADFCCQVLNVGQEVIDKGLVSDDVVQADDFHRGRPYAWEKLGNPITEQVPPTDPAHRMILRLVESINAIRRSI